MNFIKSAIIFLFAFIVTTSASASLIKVNYSVDFTSYSNNAAWFVNPPSDYDTDAEQAVYLAPTDFFITVMYDTDRQGRFLDNESGNFRLLGIWAEVVDMNIPLSNFSGPYTYNFVNSYTRNKGQDLFIKTMLLSMFEIAYDYDSLNEIKVGDAADYFTFYKKMAGELETFGRNTAQPENIYHGSAVIQSITYVPEPSALALFALGFFGLFSSRIKLKK